MKLFIVGLLALASVSAFAAKSEVVCGTAAKFESKAIEALNTTQLAAKSVTSVSQVSFVKVNDGGVIACVSVINE